jgi:hypothetical protein
MSKLKYQDILNTLHVHDPNLDIFVDFVRPMIQNVVECHSNQSYCVLLLVHHFSRFGLVSRMKSAALPHQMRKSAQVHKLSLLLISFWNQLQLEEKKSENRKNTKICDKYLDILCCYFCVPFEDIPPPHQCDL